ncbi:hypothetical protein FC25_GL001500 [Ligilactobacillus ruminis DSM 20403 = NBRC 102161]|uniref:hypothetical protein n=1 Tax=Ligilactobacillus ruminis TaxID=1623 RepID=UPI0006F1B43C|nr:hypothetical protein [Ligilactobacillus ruminis]KRM83375.1 hypothetical protein FC25_GL001500 [Ligilactobacillus ruminis DSM 20403 = NBRC 102161]
MKDKKLCKYCRRIAVSLALLTAVSIADSTSVFASEKADQSQSIETSANTSASSDMVKDSSSSVNGNDSAASSTDETNSTSVSKGTQNAVSQQSKADVAVSDANSLKSDSKLAAVASVADSSQPQNGWWKDEDYYWYYFENGEPVKDKLKTIGNYTYHFLYDGKMDTNNTFGYESGLGYNYYRVDDQGHLVKGWYQNYWGDWYYYDKKTGQAFTGLQTIDNQKYYFNTYNYGKMSTNEEVEYQHKYYRTDENGHLVKGWYKKYYSWYYYDNNGVRVSGYRPINGKGYYFYFDYDGQMIDDDKAHIFDGVFYYINGSGIVLKRQAITKDEWVRVGNDWYYVKNSHGGEFLSDETATLGGRTYHFDRDGKMSKNCSVIDYYQNMLYYYGSDGALVLKKMDADNDGWVKSGNNWYYVKDKDLVKSEFFGVDGHTYHFDFNGRMSTNYVTIYRNVFYYFGANGALSMKRNASRNGWIKAGNDWYYVKNRTLVKGEFFGVGGHTYHFDSSGKMSANYATTYKNAFYYFRSDGALSMKQTITKDGWIKASNNWYYVKNKSLVRDQLINVGRYTYYMYANGKMAVNTTIRYYDSATHKYVSYRVDSKGHVIK